MQTPTSPHLGTSRIMTTGSLVVANQALRPRLIELLSAIATHAQANEPGTSRLAVLIPYEDDDGVTAYVIEEFVDEAAEATHGQSPPVQDFVAFVSDTANPVLASPPVFFRDKVTLSTGEVCSFTRPAVNDYPESYLILATFHYQPGLTSAALPGWKKLVEYARAEEPLTLTYTVLEDTETHKLRTVEAYASKEYARTVHLTAPVVQENQAQNGHMRVPGMPATIYRGHKVAGYLGRV